MTATNGHYVPQFYLRNFSKGSHVYVYDKETCYQRRFSTKQICSEMGYFNLPEATICPEEPVFCDDQIIENSLNKDVENVVVHTLRDVVNNRSLNVLAPDDFRALIEWVAWIYLSGPSYKEVLNTSFKQYSKMYTENISAAELEEMSMDCFGLLLPKDFLRGLLREGIQNSQLGQARWLSILLNAQGKMFDTLYSSYCWHLDDYKSEVLCTSDRPVALCIDSCDKAVGYSMPGSLLVFPLSSTLCLIGGYVGEGKAGVISTPRRVNNDPMARLAQMAMWIKSRRYIIGSSFDVLPDEGTVIPSVGPDVRCVRDRNFLGVEFTSR